MWQPYFPVHFWPRKPPTPSPVGGRRQVQRQIPLYLSLLPGQGAKLLRSDATEFFLGQLWVFLLKVLLALSQPQLKGADRSEKMNVSIWKSDPGLYVDKKKLHNYYLFIVDKKLYYYFFLKRAVFSPNFWSSFCSHIHRG